MSSDPRQPRPQRASSPSTGRRRRAEARALAQQTRTPSTATHSRRRWYLATSLVVLLGGLAASLWFAQGPGRADNTDAPVATVHTVVHGQSADVAFADGSGWQLSDTDGTIRRFDPTDGHYNAKAVAVATRPVTVIAAYGELWVADAVANEVDVVDPTTGRLVGRPIAVSAEPVSLASGERGIWVASLIGRTVSLIDPATRQVEASSVLPDGAVRVAVGDGAVWVTGETDTLAKVSPVPSGKSLSSRSVVVGDIPIGLAVTPTAVWVANSASGTLSKVDPRTMDVTATVLIGRGDVVTAVETGPAATSTTTTQPGSSAPSDPVVLSAFGGKLWVGDGALGRLMAIDPATGAQTGKAVLFPGAPRRFEVFNDQLWATTANAGAVVRIEPS